MNKLGMQAETNCNTTQAADNGSHVANLFSGWLSETSAPEVRPASVVRAALSTLASIWRSCRAVTREASFRPMLGRWLRQSEPLSWALHDAQRPTEEMGRHQYRQDQEGQNKSRRQQPWLCDRQAPRSSPIQQVRVDYRASPGNVRNAWASPIPERKCPPQEWRPHRQPVREPGAMGKDPAVWSACHRVVSLGARNHRTLPTVR